MCSKRRDRFEIIACVLAFCINTSSHKPRVQTEIFNHCGLTWKIHGDQILKTLLDSHLIHSFTTPLNTRKVYITTALGLQWLKDYRTLLKRLSHPEHIINFQPLENIKEIEPTVAGATSKN
jgi:predicted transcriptional regulator